jgi:hypothetical protein
MHHRKQQTYHSIFLLLFSLLLSSTDNVQAFVRTLHIASSSSSGIRCRLETTTMPSKMAAATVSPLSHPITTLKGMWSQNDEIEGTDRLKACIPYLLPLMDGDHFGYYIYQRIPFMGVFDDWTIGPLSDLAHGIPFLTLGLFVALTLGTRFNTDMSRNLRFSAQQAALIDVALLIPELISSSFVEDPVPRYIAEPCSTFVWYAYMSAVIYSVYSNLRGKKPDQIPILSQYSELMVGPF